MNVQRQKIYRDLWLYRLRTGLSIFTICVGLVVFGGIASALEALTGTYEYVFRQSHPAQVVMNIPAFDDALLRRIDDAQGIQHYDARFTTTNARIATSADNWMSLELHARDDFSSVVLHEIFAETTTFSVAPERGTLWLDRSILRDHNLAIGDVLLIENADGTQNPITISGFVNDIIAYPTSFSDTAVAYISMETLQDLSLAVYVRPNQPTFNTLYIRFDAPTGDVLTIRDWTNQLEDQIKSDGYTVLSTTNLTDEPPLKSQTDALNFLLVISSILAFAVTGVLIANFVSAIIGRQVNEIGIMKSLGAMPSQIVVLYFTMVIIIGLVAFALSLPFTGVFAKVLGTFLATLIDIDVTVVTVPLNIRLTQFVIAIALPVVASLLPIYQGARATVKATLRNDGNTTNKIIRWLVFDWSSLAPLLLIRLSIRNIFLKPGRFFLTSIALTFPGALFIASFGIETSLKTLDSDLTKSLYSYDIEMSFDGTAPIKLITQLAEKQTDVTYVEAWRQGSVYRIYPELPPPNTPSAEQQPNQQIQQPITNTGDSNLPPPQNQRPPRPNNNSGGNLPPPPRRNQNANTPPLDPNNSEANLPPRRLNPPVNDTPEESISSDLLIRGVPINSNLISFTPNQLLQGGWIQDSDDILLTLEAYELISLNVDRSPGFIVGLPNNQEQHWDVSGVTGNLLFAEGFIDINTFERFIPYYESSIRLAIVTASDDPEVNHRLIEDLRQVYNDNGINVNSSFYVNEFVVSREDRLNIVTQTLILLAVVIATVSIIGLTSTISINIRERTKSIGILRSLGGNYRHLSAMVVSESLTIVFISYILAVILSFLVGHLMTNFLSNSIYMLTTPYQPQFIGVIIWFVVIAIVGILVAIGPALYAINVTISDTLRYEG